MKNYSKEKIVKRAETKKNEKIKKICQKRDEMISYNISSDLIDDWFEKELQKIEKEYNNKINDDKIYIRELNKQKKKK
jgi:transcriptional regulator CtsR